MNFLILRLVPGCKRDIIESNRKKDDFHMYNKKQYYDMNPTKVKLLQIQETLNDLIDSDATQEEAILVVNRILNEIDVDIQPDINWLEQEMESCIPLSKVKVDLLNTYKKTMRLIQYTRDHFDFWDPEAERRSMFTDGLNDPDFEL